MVYLYPTIGKYLVIAFGYATGNNDRYIWFIIERTADGSNWTKHLLWCPYNSGTPTLFLNNQYNIVNVTNTSTHKIQIKK